MNALINALMNILMNALTNALTDTLINALMNALINDCGCGQLLRSIQFYSNCTFNCIVHSRSISSGYSINLFNFFNLKQAVVYFVVELTGSRGKMYISHHHKFKNRGT